MKKISCLLVILAGLSAFSYGQKFSSEKGSDICSHHKSHKQNFQHLVKVKSPNTPTHSYDVLDYDLDLDIHDCFISPYSHYFTGTDTITFKVVDELSSIKLNAMNLTLTINSIGLAGVTYSHEDDTLEIQLDDTYSTDDIVQVSIDYTHANVDDGHFYAAGQMVFTDCEPEGARYWYPCWDKPSDKATLDMTVRVPENVALGSNGILENEWIEDGAKYLNWVHNYQISTYLVVLAGKVNFNLDIVDWNGTPIYFYYNNGENPTNVENYIGEMATFFSETFCDHPFDKNGFASLNSEFTWGGMEDQTLTLLCQNCWYESLIAHEFAHQWFGDMITCGTWADLWLNEGFATYSESLWFGHTGGYSAYKDDVDNCASSYLSGNPGWPIYNPEWAEVTPGSGTLFNSAITYNKAACVLHTLRYVLGDETFFEFISSYANDEVDFKYDNAVTEDFITKVNTISGEDMNWFFDQWVFSPNHPEYENQYNIIDNGDGNWMVNFNAIQSQGGIYFQMPLEIKIEFTDGSEVVEEVFNSENFELFSFTYDKEPDAVLFDPDDQIVLKEASLSIAQNYPSNFTAYGVSQSQIDIEWVKNLQGNDVILAWSEDGNYGSPVNGITYTIGDQIPDGGTVLYIGSETEYSHLELELGTTYYYKIWSLMNDDPVYSAGVVTQATTKQTTIFYDDFEASTGWTLNGEWEIGEPQGLGGNYGYTDPTNAFAGTKILGVDLSGQGEYPGDYEADLSEKEYMATSPEINCSDFTNVTLSFQRWLGLESDQYDHGYIDISTDGSSWTEIWENNGTIEENSWGEYIIDISEYASNEASVKLRFSIGSTDEAWQYCGWNIDEFYVSGISSVEAFLNVDNQNFTVSEDSGKIEFIISSNVNWTIVSDQTWCTVDLDSGFGNDTINASYEANSGFERNAIMTVSAEGLEDINVLIEQSAYVSVTENSFSEIIIFPNPGKNEINISNAENSMIKIFDNIGNCVLTQIISSSNEKINISELAAGNYIINISSKNETINLKYNVLK